MGVVPGVRGTQAVIVLESELYLLEWTVDEVLLRPFMQCN